MNKYSTSNENLPAIDKLKQGKQWVCYTDDKVPYNPLTGYRAKANDASTWCNYEQALTALQHADSQYAGIGREFVKEDTLVGIDLDKCIDEHGTLSTYASEIVKRLNSYTEVSPSGHGLHIWVYGVLPDCIGPDASGVSKIEMYDSERYFTVTGIHQADTPTSIEYRAEEVMNLHAEVRKARQDGKQAKKGTRGHTSTGGDSPYGIKALQGECKAVALAVPGARNHQLNTSAYVLGQLIGGGELSQNTVENALYDAATMAGLDDSEVVKTMRSGLEAGKAEPRQAPKNERYQPYTPGTTSTNGNGNFHQPVQDDTSFILTCLGQDEWGDALLFAHLNRGKAVYDHTEGQWYLFNSHHWYLDEQGKVKHLVSGQLASVYLQAAATINLQASSLNSEDDAAKLDTLKKTIKALTNRALLLRKVSRNANILNFASSQEGMGVTSGQWDTNHWLLPVENGVVELQTGQLRDGKPEDYIRTFSPTHWQGLDAPAPQWSKALNEIFGDRLKNERAELISFLQRLFGYGITGFTYEHVFLVMYGEEGRNGKDTITAAIAHAIGRMAGAISNDVLLSTKHSQAGGAKPHLVDLQGKRIGWASEPPCGARFDVAQVKQLTGGGAISARQLYGKEYQFTPTHLLLLLTNHKPHADATDKAFWERLRLVTFNMRFVTNPVEVNERKKDAALWKTLEKEASGILAWLVRGCLAWQSEGLVPPSSVLQDVEEYRKEEDNIALFLEECCVVKEGLTTRASQMYETYAGWCKSGSMFPLNSKNFGTLLSKQFRKDRNNTGLCYHGVGILANGYDDDSVGSNGPTRNSVGSNSNPTRATNEPVDMAEGTKQAYSGVGCVGLNGKVPSYKDDFSEKRKFSDLPYTPYTTSAIDTTVEWPVVCPDSVVYSESNPTLTLHDMAPTLHDMTPETASNYPYDVIATMGYPEPIRACLQCCHKNWLPWYDSEAWVYQCGDCNPGLLSSHGKNKFFTV